mgnify:CR=1 FL=1
MNETEKAFYAEVRSAVDTFTQEAVSRIKNVSGGEDHGNLQKIIGEAIAGTLHSVFVSIDGGTALSDQGKALELIERKTGEPLTTGALHENFIAYL